MLGAELAYVDTSGSLISAEIVPQFMRMWGSRRLLHPQEQSHLRILQCQALSLPLDYKIGVQQVTQLLYAWYTDPVLMALLILAVPRPPRTLLRILALHHGRRRAVTTLRSILRVQRMGISPWWFPQVGVRAGYGSVTCLLVYDTKRTQWDSVRFALEHYDRRSHHHSVLARSLLRDSLAHSVACQSAGWSVTKCLEVPAVVPQKLRFIEAVECPVRTWREDVFLGRYTGIVSAQPPT